MVLGSPWQAFARESLKRVASLHSRIGSSLKDKS